MFKIFYNVRVVEDGKVVLKRRFAAKDVALRFVADKLVRRRQVRIARQRVFQLETIQNTEWGLQPHEPWEKAAGPLRMAFLHTSVTTQLPVSASVEQEKEQMRLLDQIAHSRGFNGISYSWAIFPSGRCYEGRGDLVIEAATEGFNTSSDSFCFVGNGDVFALSSLQKVAVRMLIDRKQRQGHLVMTGLDVRGHREVSTQGKSCPGRMITDEDIEAVQRQVNA